MNIEQIEDFSKWYVIYTHPKQEERASDNLRSWGVETLNAKLRTRRFNEFTGAPSYLSKPLFPRYVFAKFNAQKQLGKICFTRGVNNVVSFGGLPASVDDSIIQVVNDRIDKNGYVKDGEELKRGDKVIVEAGPLRDLVGVFEQELKDSERISILLTTISYQGRLVVSKDSLKKIND